MTSIREYDVIVAGGGPAGSATATLAARQGRRVLLLDRERFPRFRIGESLMPATYWSLERLGVLDKMRGSKYPRKHSVQFFLADGRSTAPFYFRDIDGHESSSTWQVDRTDFDKMLLDHAVAGGVEVQQEVTVRDVLFDGARAVGVLAERLGTIHEEIRCRVVVDATGQAALLSRRLGLRRDDPKLRNIALFTRYRGAVRGEGIDEGATLIFHTEEARSWFWYIPLPDDVVSVGVVGPVDHLVRGRSADTGETYAEELARCPALQPRLRGAEQLTPVRGIQDFSYISRQIAGDGWILAGDAFGFLDPIYSSGVFLALKGAELAADSIDDAFRHDDFSAQRLGAHGPQFLGGMEAIRKLVYAFYDPEFSFARFFSRHPECKDEITHLLTGNVYRRDTSRLAELLEGEAGFADYRPLRLGGETN